jgi:hypothetical protein
VKNKEAQTMPRKLPNDSGELWLAEGEYGKDPRNNIWYARPPGMHAGSLENHQVVEHEDGTITVMPSILITEYDNEAKIVWHGHLERGFWRRVRE